MKVPLLAKLSFSTIKARPMANGYVKVKTGDATAETVYNEWYKAVYEPSKENAEVQTVQTVAAKTTVKSS